MSKCYGALKFSSFCVVVSTLDKSETKSIYACSQSLTSIYFCFSVFMFSLYYFS